MMLSKDSAHVALRRLFRRDRVVELGPLLETLGTRSRMTVFRRLREVDYLTSYSHGGRYYTLRDIPEFDEHGLWMCRAIGFSRFGNLKATTVELVEAGSAGRTHDELQGLLRVRVHNTLLGMVRAGRIGRETIAKRYLYVSADLTRAADQVAQRQAQPSVSTLSIELMLAVLVEALRAGEALAPPSVVAARLAARGLTVTTNEVQQVFAQHRLTPGKKTVASPSRRSRR
jgi:hypothetical protein